MHLEWFSLARPQLKGLLQKYGWIRQSIPRHQFARVLYRCCHRICSPFARNNWKRRPWYREHVPNPWLFRFYRFQRGLKNKLYRILWRNLFWIVLSLSKRVFFWQYDFTRFATWNGKSEKVINENPRSLVFWICPLLFDRLWWHHDLETLGMTLRGFLGAVLCNFNVVFRISSLSLIFNLVKANDGYKNSPEGFFHFFS